VRPTATPGHGAPQKYARGTCPSHLRPLACPSHRWPSGPCACAARRWQVRESPGRRGRRVSARARAPLRLRRCAGHAGAAHTSISVRRKACGRPLSIFQKAGSRGPCACHCHHPTSQERSLATPQPLILLCHRTAFPSTLTHIDSPSAPHRTAPHSHRTAPHGAPPTGSSIVLGLSSQQVAAFEVGLRQSGLANR
jgi:hypothetical protein